MRHNQNRRSRGRSRKGPNPLTRSYELNGPDVKVRGNAAHVAEKYMSLARDAQASGDVVAAENYLQHAEHYNRIVMAAQTQFQQSQPQFREGGEEGYDDDRQMNGRGCATASNRTVDGRDDDGDDRFEAGEGDDDRGYPPDSRRRQNERPNDRASASADRASASTPRPTRPARAATGRERFQQQDEPQPEARAAGRGCCPARRAAGAGISARTAPPPRTSAAQRDRRGRRA